MDQDIRSLVDRVEGTTNHLWQELRSRGGTKARVAERVMHRLAARRRWRLVSLVFLGVAVAVAAAAVAWLVFRSGGATAVSAASGVPALVSRAQLERLAASVDHPVYWAGPRRGFRYELTVTTPGRIFVRYLPDGVAAGDPRPNFLTVGTYPGARSFAGLKRAANREGATWVGLDHGGLVVFAARSSNSVYLGYRGERYQVEVFAPSGDTARKLVLGGAIVPVS
jgi:hypothetical protein